MTHETDTFAQLLRAAREAKGLSQRELSARARVPQAHISKIENGAVDLRVSSLVSLARALDLELTLVPRKALSAVQSIVRSSEPSATVSVSAPRELTALQRLLFSVPVQAQKPREFSQLQSLLRDLHRVPLAEPQRDALKQVAASFKALQEILGSKDVDALKVYLNSEQGLSRIREALARTQSLRNKAAHGAGTRSPETVHPAYSLDEDDDA